MRTNFSTHDLQLVNPVVRFRNEPAWLHLEGLWTIVPRRESDGTYTVCFNFEESLPDSPEFKSNVVPQNQDVDDSYW